MANGTLVSPLAPRRSPGYTDDRAMTWGFIPASRSSHSQADPQDSMHMSPLAANALPIGGDA